LFLGVFLGGVMPMLIEDIGIGLGVHNSIFREGFQQSATRVLLLQLGIAALPASLVLVSFFASSLAKNFLQAAGLAAVTFIGCTMLAPVLVNERILFYNTLPAHSILPLFIAVPTLIVTLLWLAYLNFNNFRDGWPLVRRNVGGIIGALLFIFVSSNVLYHRAWESFEPAEPAHSAAKFSLANPPTLHNEAYDNLLVRLPDGRVWTDYLNWGMYDYDSSKVKWLWHYLSYPLPESGGAPRFIAGSNWASATARHVDFNQHYDRVAGYLDTVGIRTDGTLWISDASKSGAWTGDKMNRFGDGTNWRHVVRSRPGVLLLKSDGTLWRWGTNHFESSGWQTNWPNLRTDSLYQIGTDSDWKDIYGSTGINFARKFDGRVWKVGVNDKSGEDELRRETNWDQVSFQTLSVANGDSGDMAYVRPDGTLWVEWQYPQNGTNVDSGFVRAGTETNWTAVALTWNKMVALKSDGSLWQWDFNRWQGINQGNLSRLIQKPPTRVGIHNDWVAIANTWEDVIALAADGSLWLWPNREQYEQATLLKLPKQPEFLGNVFGKAD
jgi:hypothetical protein